MWKQALKSVLEFHSFYGKNCFENLLNFSSRLKNVSDLIIRSKFSHSFSEKIEK
jgi:hypothetical protein